eukprot:UN20652
MTPLGRRQVEGIGSFIRERYVDDLNFLSPTGAYPMNDNGLLGYETELFAQGAVRTIETAQIIGKSTYPLENGRRISIAVNAEAKTKADKNHLNIDEVMKAPQNVCKDINKFDNAQWDNKKLEKFKKKVEP